MGLVGTAALPDAALAGVCEEAGDGEVGVEVLPELRDHPIRTHRPRVHPVAAPVLAGALGDDGAGAWQGVHGVGDEGE